MGVYPAVLGEYSGWCLQLVMKAMDFDYSGADYSGWRLQLVMFPMVGDYYRW